MPFSKRLKVRKNLLPVDDLGLQGDTPQDVYIPDDIGITLAYLVGKGPNGPRWLNADSAGNLAGGSSGGGGTTQLVDALGNPLGVTANPLSITTPTPSFSRLDPFPYGNYPLVTASTSATYDTSGWKYVQAALFNNGVAGAGSWTAYIDVSPDGVNFINTYTSAAMGGAVVATMVSFGPGGVNASIPYRYIRFRMAGAPGWSTNFVPTAFLAELLP